MIEELRYEIKDVRRAISALQLRVTKLEEFAMIDSGTAMSAAAEGPSSLLDLSSPVGCEAPAQQFCAVQPPPTAWSELSVSESPCDDRGSTEVEHTATYGADQDLTTSVAQSESFDHKFANHGSSHSKPQGKAQEKEGLEVWIGKNLNKIGIAFLVIGCALALIYQYQYFPPLLKILAGILFGVGLIQGGEWFEKKSSFDWYGHALTGGGWALVYFSVYAAHHFHSVQIIDSVVVDLILLLGVAAGAVAYSLKYRSEVITSISFTLAFITICLSHISAFSVLALAFLVAAMAVLVSKMRWYNLLILGEGVAYGIYLWVVLPQITFGQNTIFALSVLDSNFLSAVSFSTFCWMVFNFLNLDLKPESSRECKFVIASALVNSLAFVPTVLNLMAPIHSEWQFSFLLASAVAYGLASLSAAKHETPGVDTLHTAIALFLLTAAVPFELKGDWITALWCLEVPLLIWTGLKYDMPIMRQFAAGLACICFIKLHCAPLSLVLSGTATFSFALSTLLYRSPKTAAGVIRSDRTASYFYFFLTMLVARSMISDNISAAWLPLAYVVQGAIATLLGLKLKDRIFRAAGMLAIYGCASLSFLSGMDATSRIGSGVIVLLLFHLSDCYKRLEREDHFSVERGLQFVHYGAAVSVLTVLAWQIVPPQLTSVAWALEALSFLAYGFFIEDKSARVAAFAVSALTMQRFVSFDLKNTCEFIFAGVTMRPRILVGICDLSVLSLAAACYALPGLKKIVGTAWSTGFYSYMALIAIGAGWLTYLEVPSEWLALAFSLECLLAILLGFVLRLKLLRAASTVGMFASQLALLFFSMHSWEVFATSLLIGVQYSLCFCYHNLDGKRRQEKLASIINFEVTGAEDIEFEEGMQLCYGVAGSITCALLLLQAVPGHWLSIAWTVEAIALLMTGFRLKDKPLRFSGLAMLALVIMRLLFVELASLETIYRIVSFIAAGLVLLLASLAYTLNGTRTHDEKKSVF